MADTPAPLLAPDAATRAQLSAIHPELDADQERKLSKFLALLHAKNLHMNLTAVRDPADMWERHVLDSLSLLPWFPTQASAADLGSGGGLPALPLAIVRPHVQLTLVESVGKKASFLREAAAELGLDNVRVLSERIEAVGRGPLRASVQCVTARAVARLPVLLELAIPLLREGGTLLAIKGEQAQLEIDESARALRELRAEVADAERTPTGTVVIVRKTAATPARYPRKPGEPKRKPLR